MEAAFREAAQDLLHFIAASPSPFHAVEEASRRLEAAGFQRLEESEPWDVEAGGRYFTTRNGSSLAAFVIGGESLPEAGFRVIGAHTDSPNLRLKPVPSLSRHGYRQLGVAVYGGALVASWADRDLGLAGRAFVDQGTGPEPRLIRIDRPVARVPQVAIHLDREVNDKGLAFNKETQLPPVVGLGDGEWDFLGWLGTELGVAADRILDHEIMLYDVQPPTFAGLEGDLLFAPRLDNLASCHAALAALLARPDPTAATRVAVLYDNEEVGSSTRQGASGPLLTDLLSRLVGPDPEANARARARSVLVSADMAHAVHPNYPEKHESRHQPRLNGGPVIKYNANARYATDAESGAIFQRLCREAGIPYQKFAMRSDMPCGSTIGPLVSTRLGIRTVDVGNPMLSMHSVREMAGALDPLYMIRALTRFFED